MWEQHPVRSIVPECELVSCPSRTGIVLTLVLTGEKFPNSEKGTILGETSKLMISNKVTAPISGTVDL